MSVNTLINTCTTTNKPTLKLGDQGTDVNNLRQLLAASNRGFGIAGLGLGDIFDTRIDSIVRAFQYQVFLDPDGIVGPKTWKALCADAPVDMPTITEGAKGDTIRLAQQRLIQCGYDLGAIDGDFGPRTLAATRQFQVDQQLVVDGIIGPKTWNALSFCLVGGGY